MAEIGQKFFRIKTGMSLTHAASVAEENQPDKGPIRCILSIRSIGEFLIYYGVFPHPVFT